MSNSILFSSYAGFDSVLKAYIAYQKE